MPKFINPNAPEGRHILNDRYVFVDGVLECSKSDAAKIHKVLTVYNGCEFVADEEVEVESVAAESGSLAVDNTKNGAEPVVTEPVVTEPKAKK